MKIEAKKTDHSFAWFNITQFLGALNDNIFKLLVIYFLIGAGGAEKASRFQPIAQALNVLPFLLFLAYAGRLADRHSKRNLIVWCKAAELIVMLFSVLAFWTGIHAAVGIVLFLMYAQSTFFAPNKYGIICELVPPDDVTRANGQMQAFYFMAILFAMIIAPWISKFVSGHYVSASVGCVLIAAAGLAFSIVIKTTRPMQGQSKASVLFVLDILRTFRSIHRKKALILPVIGSAYFSFIGVSMYFCVIPYGMAQLDMTKENSTYLFVFALVGIALGSLLAGGHRSKSSRNHMIPVGILLLGLCSTLIGAIKPDFWFTGSLMLLMGLGAGMFIIPINVYIQMQSPNHRRGEIIGASEFLSRLTTLFSIVIFLILTQAIRLSSSQLFIIFGLAAMLASMVILLFYRD